MRYALIKFRVYLLGEQTFAVYTDHASLRTAMKPPHLSQRMARWLSFFAEYNFAVHYKPGKNNILADSLSRRPDYDPRVVLGRQVIDDEDDSEEHCAVCAASGINLTSVSPKMDLRDAIAAAYADDAVYANILVYLSSPSDETLEALSRNTRNQIDRYHLDGDLLCYNIDRFDALRVVVPNDDDLRARIMHEFHDSPMGAHLGREKTFAAVSRDFYWPRMYKWIRKWVRTCEPCQRVKPFKSSQAPLHPLLIATEAWRSVSMDFVFGFPPDADGRNGVLVFVNRFTKMVHLTPVSDTVTAAETAAHFVDCAFRHHGLPELIVSDRDPRFTCILPEASDSIGRSCHTTTAGVNHTRHHRHPFSAALGTDGSPPVAFRYLTDDSSVPLQLGYKAQDLICVGLPHCINFVPNEDMHIEDAEVDTEGIQYSHPSQTIGSTIMHANQIVAVGDSAFVPIRDPETGKDAIMEIHVADKKLASTGAWLVKPFDLGSVRRIAFFN
ncbi:unnamed protein product [Phytophthora fragariaefolia]|uniref:Unnamed protein product n=1 Tax=Phytophthora fragariaefolia TaxID=1490495 RepID=A0A9W6Y8K1_9STRA|nr:unnamed protein product [Phytophthora fragariaefolia]